MAKSLVYTRTGDSLDTSLLGGVRVRKSEIRLEAYGTIDELSSFIGFLAADSDVIDNVRYSLLKIQNMLFNIGAHLANPKSTETTEVTGLTNTDIQEMEGWIDKLDAELPPLCNFILPGGCSSAAKANMARTVCRRAERRLAEFAQNNQFNPLVSAYLNRLSDYLFVVGRYMNKINDFEEVIWHKPTT